MCGKVSLDGAVDCFECLYGHIFNIVRVIYIWYLFSCKVDIFDKVPHYHDL